MKLKRYVRIKMRTECTLKQNWQPTFELTLLHRARLYASNLQEKMSASEIRQQLRRVSHQVQMLHDVMDTHLSI